MQQETVPTPQPKYTKIHLQLLTLTGMIDALVILCNELDAGSRPIEPSASKTDLVFIEIYDRLYENLVEQTERLRSLTDQLRQMLI